MGYTTEFKGEMEINPPLTQEQIEYIQKFNQTRRMQRNSNIVKELPDPIRDRVGLGIGTDGEFFVGGQGFMGQSYDSSVVANNDPPKTQPGLWCKWTCSDDGRFLFWDGGEKFYDYIDWMAYILDNFMIPWERTLNGQIEWRGEDWDDHGIIIITDNVMITTK